MATSVYQINVVFHGRKLKESHSTYSLPFFVGNGYHGKIVISTSKRQLLCPNSAALHLQFCIQEVLHSITLFVR